MKIATVSLNQAWEDKEKNLNFCREFIAKAAAKKVDLIIFPEMTLTGFSNDIKKISEERNHSSTINSFCELAKKFNIAIIFGVVIKEGEKASNQACFIDKKGKILAAYKKIHPFSFAKENDFYVGGEELKSVAYNGFNFGLTICYDLRFPEIYSALAKTNEIIINIANWPKKRLHHWNSLLVARAIENQVFIIGVNRTGTDGNGLQYEESSAIYNANGDKLECEIDSEMKIFTLDKNWLKNFKKTFDTTRDRKISFYKSVL
jgi:predicted amidohydrolase